MVLGVLLIVSVFWWMGGPPGMHAGMHGGPFFWGWLPFIFLWFGGMRLLRGARHHARHHRHTFAPSTPSMPSQDPALVTLRERFARGEIDHAEYEERRAILLGRRGTPGDEAPGKDSGDESSKPEWPDLV